MNRAHRTGLALLAAAALALPAAADDVHLTNGKVFEDVVARVEGDKVVVQMRGGALRLPASRVARIERRDSALTEYLERRQAVAVDRDAGAADWLALAVWARDRGLDSSFREAARKAATLEPDLPGLPPLMQALGYVRDEAGGPWMLPDELMARRGYVRHGDSWITAGERARSDSARSSSARDAQRDASRDRALEQLAAAARAQAEAARAREERELAERTRTVAVPMVYAVPGWYVPIPIPVPVPVPGEPPAASPEPPLRGRGGSNRGGWESRVPGSLGSAFIPGRLNPEAAPPPGRLDPR